MDTYNAKHDNRGMSLLELIVAIVIIAIVGSGVTIAAVSQIEGAREKQAETVRKLFLNKCEEVSTNYNVKKFINENTPAGAHPASGFCVELGSDGQLSFRYLDGSETVGDELSESAESFFKAQFADWKEKYDGEAIVFNLSQGKQQGG